jgi:hypothetical protein
VNIIIKSTPTLTDIHGVPVRLWDGMTERGVRCKVFVHLIAVHDQADQMEFERELKQMLPPAKPPIRLSQLL